MFIIKENTEKVLLQELRKHYNTFPTHRCLQLKFSQLEQNQIGWFQNFKDELQKHIDDKSCQIYLCNDGDIFIITRYITQKSANEFLTLLLPKLMPSSIKRMAILFEIGVDWSKLRTLCEKKIEIIEIANSKKQQNEQENITKVNIIESISTIDQHLVSSLPMRRTKRKYGEVMVVEDDPFSQKLISNSLNKKYSLSMTSDGQGAIMNYVNKAPDVLFLDIGLPDIDGHEVLKQLFKIDPDAYIIMFSGNGDKENIMKAIDLGAKGFVGKPFTQEKLFQYIEKSPFIQEKQK